MDYKNNHQLQKTIASLMLIVVLACSCIPFITDADAAKCGESTYWEFDNGTLTISGNGKVTDDTWKGIVDNESIIRIVIESEVSEVIGNVFSSTYPNLRSITVSSKTMIAGDAFPFKFYINPITDEMVEYRILTDTEGVTYALALPADLPEDEGSISMNPAQAAIAELNKSKEALILICILITLFALALLGIGLAFRRMHDF